MASLAVFILDVGVKAGFTTHLYGAHVVDLYASHRT